MQDFLPAGFFALRTPLLPFDEIVSWSNGLEAPVALGLDPTDLEQAIERDRDRLRIRLRELMSRPEVRDALFVASPHLDEMFDIWLREPDSEQGLGIERALVRYFVRMAGRATPFGLCAGCSVGRVDDETNLVIEGRATYQRHTRLGMDYLVSLTDALQRDSTLRKFFTYRPNSSLYSAAGRVRYVVSRLKEKERSYHLVAAEETDYLAATLSRAANGSTFETLAGALVEDEVTPEEAKQYIEELIESQILVADIAVPVTGSEPVHPLIEQLRQRPETVGLSEKLDQTRVELAAMDADGLGVPPARYRALAHLLEGLPGKTDLPRLFQVDMIKPAPEATLGKPVLSEIFKGVQLLQRLSRPVHHDRLKRFRDAFSNRYEMREVPLVEALDEEIGVGFGSGRDTAPLLEGLHFPEPEEQTAPGGAREKFLMRKLSEALQRRAFEMVLDRSELEKLMSTTPPPLPDAFAVMATVAASSHTALERGDFRLVLDSAAGPSGATILGRFCHADEDLRQLVAKHLRAEESLRPEAVFAEIVHLPEGHFGNFICRPAFREHEIPYLGYSGVPLSQQIPITDLTVSVRVDRIILRSRRLEREVVPRMTNAHNYSLSSLGVYHFLCALQQEGTVPDMRWSWGALSAAPFLPRVTMGKLVLSRAQWRLNKEELKRLREQRGPELFKVAQKFRVERSLPRWIAVADSDNTLPVDLDNILSIEALVHLIGNRDEATLVEIFPAPDQLCAHGPEGNFMHELVIPFVRTSHGDATAVEGTHRPANSNFIDRDQPGRSSSPAAPRTFPPVSEWLFVKLYTGTGTADRLLGEAVAPLVRKVLDAGAADRWFFIRYGDPDWHLRLRFHGAPDRLQTEVLPLLQRMFFPLLKDGRLWKLQFDTYEREVERYGGPEGVALAEKLFQADSEAVLELIPTLEGDEGLDARWRLILRGVDALLNDFGFDIGAKHGLFQQTSRKPTKEEHVDKALRAELAEKFRKERNNLEQLLHSTDGEGIGLSPGFEILHRRSQRIAPIVTELKALDKAGRLSVSIEDFAMSCAHMYANRLLRSAHRHQELVIHNFLSRLYQSESARRPA